MQLADILQRVESRLKALGLSAHAASTAAGKPYAIRNIRRAVQLGNRQGVSTATIAALAPVLQASVGWLMTGEDEEPPAAEPPEPASTAAPLDFAAIAIDEVLRVLGAKPEAAKELVAIIQQVAAAQPPGFPGMTAEETTRLIVRQLAERILASLPDRRG